MIECNNTAYFPARYFDYDHLHLKIICFNTLDKANYAECQEA